MKVLNEEIEGGKSGTTFVLILEKKEAQTLVAMAETAVKADRKKSSYKSFQKALTERLCCF